MNWEVFWPVLDAIGSSLTVIISGVSVLFIVKEYRRKVKNYIEIKPECINQDILLRIVNQSFRDVYLHEFYILYNENLINIGIAPMFIKPNTYEKILISYKTISEIQRNKSNYDMFFVIVDNQGNKVKKLIKKKNLKKLKENYNSLQDMNIENYRKLKSREN